MSDCPECSGTDHPSHRQRHEQLPATLATPDDVAEPDRWHVEDEARVPAWDLTVGYDHEVVAWTDGVQVGEMFHDATDVGEVEATARKILAAVAWHRHLAAIEAARAAGGAPESQRRTPGPETVGDPATPKPHVAALSRDDRTDLIVTAIENARECAAIDVTVREADGTQAPLRRLARCLDGAGLIDEGGL